MQQQTNKDLNHIQNFKQKTRSPKTGNSSALSGINFKVKHHKNHKNGSAYNNVVSGENGGIDD